MITFKKNIGLYLDQDEEALLRYVDPDQYVHKCIVESKPGKGLSDGFLLGHFQDELKDILQSFLNGGFSNRGFVLYPLVRDVSKENIRKMRNVVTLVRYLDSKAFAFPETLLLIDKNFNRSKNFAQLLVALYNDFEAIKKHGTRKAKKIVCKEFRAVDYQDQEYISPLLNLQQYANKTLKKYLVGFYLHGSLSTNDYVKGWSDLDTFLIVKKQTLKSPESLLALRYELYKSRSFHYRFDPLQHHSHMIISEYDLDYFSETYFPLILFKYSKSLMTKDFSRSIHVRKDSIKKIRSLFYFVNYFRDLYFNKKYNMKIYDVKFLFHAVTLFPTLYLQAKGIHVYKKYSFAKAKKDFEAGEWRVMKGVEKLRNHWKMKNSNIFKAYEKINPILAGQARARYLDVFKQILSENNVDTKEIIDQMFVLSEKAWTKIKRGLK
mgnify:CR=1 FL=1